MRARDVPAHLLKSNDTLQCAIRRGVRPDARPRYFSISPSFVTASSHSLVAAVI